MTEVKKYLAELIGTFTLVFIGCGSAVITGAYIGVIGISLAFGLTLFGLVYAIGNISGCHVNPAVTCAMFIAGRIEKRDAAIYIILQNIGAILGALSLFLIASGLPGYSLVSDGLGQNGYDSQSPGGYSLLSGFIAELILTAIFLFVIFGATSKKAPQGFAGLAIGITLVVIHIVGIPITGTSVNPARSLGPAIVVGGTALIQLWLFWLAPLIGATLIALAWKYFYEN
ncbi:MAG: aquaporin Z [Candidatus Lokiarchaeota archaeon]|nr:aquaporin Z [Candidatus Lokiarchaeota archaeon]